MPDDKRQTGTTTPAPINNANIAVTKAPPAPPPVDDGLVAPDSNTQETPPLRNQNRRPQRDPLQVAAENARRAQAAEGKTEPDPFIDAGLDDLEDNDPGDEQPAEEETVGGEANTPNAETDTFDEELYARARAVGYTQEEINDFVKVDGRLERMVGRLEQVRESRRPQPQQTQPKPEPKPQETFNEKALMDQLGITDPNDPIINEFRDNFKERQSMKQRLEDMEQRDRERNAAAFLDRLDSHFRSTTFTDKFGEMFGGSRSRAELSEDGAVDSREVAVRDAIIDRARLQAQRDMSRGLRPKSERVYLLEAADDLYGHLVQPKTNATPDKDGRLRDRRGLFVKRSDSHKVPEAPETGDHAARKVIRDKLGLKPESDSAAKFVEESLL